MVLRMSSFFNSIGFDLRRAKYVIYTNMYHVQTSLYVNITLLQWERPNFFYRCTYMCEQYSFFFSISCYYHTNQDENRQRMLLKLFGGTVYCTQYSRKETAVDKQGKRGQRAHQSVSKAPWFFTSYPFPIYIHLPSSFSVCNFTHTHARECVHAYTYLLKDVHAFSCVSAS